MAKRSKAMRRGDAFRRRMASALARHALTVDQAAKLPDSDLQRRRGIGPKMIDAIRAAGATVTAPSVGAPRADATEQAPAPATRDDRIVVLEHQVADLIAAVGQVQDLLRVRGIDRRRRASSEGSSDEGLHEASTDQEHRRRVKGP
jgi:hypothetical protein